MSKIGILAYGSLIEKPDVEIDPFIIDRIKNVETPFPIEFARKSKKRDYAPTVIPVETGGAFVKAQILVLADEITSQKAEDILWRRETGKVGLDETYTRPKKPGPNHVIVEHIPNWQGLETVIYTKIGSNIEDITANNLADLAIASAKSVSGMTREDGISYLISLKRQGVVTALTPEYEKAILDKTSATDLEMAWEKSRDDAV